LIRVFRTSLLFSVIGANIIKKISSQSHSKENTVAFKKMYVIAYCKLYNFLKSKGVFFTLIYLIILCIKVRL